MTTYCIGYADMINSVWYVVDAINAYSEFQISYPADHEQQRAIAEGFRRKSAASFDCCAGAIDGILVWIHKPSEEDSTNAGCSDGKFFCGRKHKFGLNCQAVCDSRGKFLEVSIIYPGSTSDCLAFEGMSLYSRLENGLLAPGLCLFGDNAYLNSVYMATPYSGVSGGGSKDAYNFYHSQLRINIECAFGMFTHRWAILRSAIPMRVSLKKTIALVVALAKLHNFCIDASDTHTPPSPALDELRTEMQGGVPLEATTASTTAAGSRVLTPRQLIDGGLHFDDIDAPGRRRRVRQYQAQANALHQELPRDFLHNLIDEANLARPPVLRRVRRSS
jgi:DDE superfamily endonuclease